ncbi:MAG: hypothetical protein LBU87_04805, partial [Lactobacillales bacterium]|nr:hypothetical protein [Lactobacillales bacterium]
GTVTALIKKTPYEITTLRTDDTTDGRHAEISFTRSYRTDARRRDFTINALYMDKSGKIYDFTDGIRDLKNKRVRFIGSPAKRVQEDYLRILRFFRFWSNISPHAPDEKTLRDCMRNAAGLSSLSWERKTAEFFKILMTKKAPRALKIMQEYRILPFILKEANIDALAAFLKVSPKSGALERFSILTAGKIPPDFKLSHAQKKHLLALGRRIIIADSDRANTLTLSETGKEVFDFNLTRALAEKRITPEKRRKLSALPLKTFPLKGGDLIRAGFPAGIRVKSLLNQARLIWADMNFTPNKDKILKHLIDRSQNDTGTQKRKGK